MIDKAKELEALLPDDIKRLTSTRDIAEAIRRTKDLPIEFNLLWLRSSLIEASHETAFNFLQAATEIKKLNIEPNVLDYLKRLKKFEGPYKCWENPTVDYFSLLKAGEGLSYQDLVKKILCSRNRLMEWEDEYIGILQGKSSKNEIDVLQETVLSRRELENAEKLYLISRMRSSHSKSSIEVDRISSKDEYLLERMSRLKRDVMMWEGVYVKLLGDGATYSHHALSTYHKDVLQSAVSRRRELLVLEEECFMPLRGKMPISDAGSMSFESLQEIIRIMAQTIKFDLPLNEERMYPSFGHDNNIHFQIDLLEMIVCSREDFLTLEDEYLCLLQDRYMKNHSNMSSSLNFDLIYFEYIWEYLLEMIVNWRNYLTLLEDTYGQKLLVSYSHMGIDSSILKRDLQNTELKKMEEDYRQLIRREWHLTIHNNLSSIDVAQIYDKYIKPEVLHNIIFLKEEINKMEMGRYTILENHARRLDHEPKRRDINRGIDELHHIALFRKHLREIEDRYFYMLQHNNGSKCFLQHAPARTKDFESFETVVGEEREFLTTLYNSIKSYNFYCSKCTTCVNKVIQHALNLEDSFDEISHEDKEVPQSCHQVLSKFLNSRGLCCRGCNSCIRIVTNRRAPKHKKSSMCKDVQTSTSSTSNKEADKRIGFQQSRSTGRWEIQRSIVLGGLIESITSLAILTSAANANISDGNIITLALANLITGLFIVRHNLSVGHEKKRLKKRGSGAGLLHYFLHLTIAFLSFLFAGLVAPLVYAFSFIESRNKNLHIITAAGASLSCTALFAILKAHIQTPTNWLLYVKTATIYVSIGVGVFGLSYVAGYICGNLMDKLSWVH